MAEGNGPRCCAPGGERSRDTIRALLLGLTITVSHYPTGASKWNPIEHRLFSPISKKLSLCNPSPTSTRSSSSSVPPKRESAPPPSFRIHPVRTTTPESRSSDAEMRQLNLAPHEMLGRWNYPFSRPTQKQTNSWAPASSGSSRVIFARCTLRAAALTQPRQSFVLKEVGIPYNHCQGGSRFYARRKQPAQRVSKLAIAPDAL